MLVLRCSFAICHTRIMVHHRDAESSMHSWAAGSAMTPAQTDFDFPWLYCRRRGGTSTVLGLKKLLLREH